MADLLAAVDDTFRQTSAGLSPWPDPHPDRSPPVDVYWTSHRPGEVADPRARERTTWLSTLAGAGLAVVDAGADVTWRVVQQPVITRVERVDPDRRGRLDLVVGHSRLGDVDDAGVVLGLGDPAETVTWFPHCGCDACDSGSQRELERPRHPRAQHRDRGVPSTVRRRSAHHGHRCRPLGGVELRPGARTAGRDVEAVLADPRGWTRSAAARGCRPGVRPARRSVAPVGRDMGAPRARLLPQRGATRRRRHGVGLLHGPGVPEEARLGR